jgi:hypothetical protein
MENPMLISWVDCQETAAKQKQFERQALAAREWFKQHGPPDAPVFPIGYAERERLKMGPPAYGRLVCEITCGLWV